MELKATILDDKSLNRTLTRIAHEIIEKNKGVSDVVLIGIKRRGVPLAKRLRDLIYNIEGVEVIIDEVDITFYRDDLTTIKSQPIVNSNNITVNVKDKNVVLVDDVLYTGRTARAAMEAVIKSGRPKTIQLAILIDRGHRELPIRADYVGKNIPTSNKEMVSVEVVEIDGSDSVRIYNL